MTGRLPSPAYRRRRLLHLQFQLYGRSLRDPWPDRSSRVERRRDDGTTTMDLRFATFDLIQRDPAPRALFVDLAFVLDRPRTAWAGDAAAGSIATRCLRTSPSVGNSPAGGGTHRID